jgi:hypothetical protein
MIEAGIYECDDFEPHPTFEKFAELIVAECVSQLNIPDVPGPISAGLNLGKIAIKQHFGVEE